MFSASMLKPNCPKDLANTENVKGFTTPVQNE